MGNLKIGSVVLGRYRVEEFIGSGGMSTVFRVKDLERNVPLAMKVLNADLAENPSILKSFQREAKALEKLAHPNIVPFYGLERTEDDSYVLFERFIDGSTLKDILRQAPGHRLSMAESITYLKALCPALGYAHSYGVVHCDIKPGNVMVDQGGNIFLTDFGVARHADSSTTTFAGAGTAAYMAPEQIKEEEVTPATDIYALGVMLYEILTGRRPFLGAETADTSGKSAGERLREAHLKLQPPDPREFRPELPEPLTAAILKALNKDPRNRYLSTMSFLNAVCSAANIELTSISSRVNPDALPTHSTPPPDSTVSHLPTFKTRPQIGLYIMLGGVALVILVIMLFNSFNPPASSSVPTSRTSSNVTEPGPIEQPQDTPTSARSAAQPNSKNSSNTTTPGSIEQPQDTPTSAKPSAQPSSEPPSANAETPTRSLPDTPTAPAETPIEPQNTAINLPQTDGMIQILVPAGEFLMGSTKNDVNAREEEYSQHTVFVNNFYIDQTEITNRMFALFVQATHYRTTAELAGQGNVVPMDKEGQPPVSGADWLHPRGPGTNQEGQNVPVVQVSWNDANAYCLWVGGRLPTEAEWEKAARGENGGIYPWGNAPLTGSQANTADSTLGSSFWSDTSVSDGFRFLAPVGSFPAGKSPYGLLDMAGNAWEWVSDWYDPGYFSTADAVSNNPQGPGSGTQKVFKGGSFTNGRKNVRSARRGYNDPNVPLDAYGFRCVRP